MIEERERREKKEEARVDISRVRVRVWEGREGAIKGKKFVYSFAKSINNYFLE